MTGDGTSVPVSPSPSVAAPASPQISAEDTASEATPAADSSENPASPPEDASDPFSVDPAVTHRAIPAAAKPTKKRPWRVRCPMCDTPGFLPRQAAGRDVKCSNPECLVPIFTAPSSTDDKDAETVRPESHENNTSGSKGPLTALVLIFVVGAVGGAWWFFSTPSAQPQAGTIERPAVSHDPVGSTASTDPVGHSEKAGQSDTPTTPTPAGPRQVSVQTIRQEAPALLIAAAQERDNNRSKPYCRLLTAEHFAHSADGKQTRAELQQLTQVGPDLSHLHITPLVSLWWHERAKQPEDQPSLLEQATRRQLTLPPSDPYAVDAGTALAAAWLAQGNDSQAQSLLHRLWQPSAANTLRLDQLLARHRRTFRLSGHTSRPAMLRGVSTPDPLVLHHLVTRGHTAEAIAWARQESDSLSRADRLADCALAMRHFAPQQELTPLLAGLGPAARGRVLARIALADAMAGSETATQSIAVAQTAMATLQKPRSITLGTIKTIYLTDIDDVTGWWLACQAEADLLGALALAQRTEEAGEHFANALALARSLGPAIDDIESRIKAATSQGNAGLTRQVGTALGLTGTDEAQQAAAVFLKKCQQWQQLARQRTSCLEQLHRFAIGHGLGKQSWQDVRSYALASDIAVRDAFTRTTLPSFLFLEFQAAGNTPATTEINASLPTGLPIDVSHRLLLAGRASLITGDLPTFYKDLAADTRQRRDRNARSARRRLLLQLVGTAVASKKPEQALHLIAGINDPQLIIWKEEAFRLAAAQLAARGEHQPAWEFATARDRGATERASLLAGLLEGLPTARTSQESD